MTLDNVHYRTWNRPGSVTGIDKYTEGIVLDVTSTSRVLHRNYENSSFFCKVIVNIKVAIFLETRGIMSG